MERKDKTEIVRKREGKKGRKEMKREIRRGKEGRGK